MIYLDANATEPLRPEARAAVLAALDLTGNPSSIHGPGRAARQVLEACRRVVAARFGAPVGGVVFTSGGTEADALAVASLGRGRRVLVGATEHDAVRAACGDQEVIPVDAAGVVDIGALGRLLTAGGPALVCLMLANNETGTVQPIGDVAALCRKFGARLHVDAVPAAGRMPVDLALLGADSLALSGHKIGGPKGAGALLLADDGHDDGYLAPLIAGGGQERGRRGGTPALPAIAGFAAAAQATVPDLLALREALERVAVAQGAIVLGGEDRLPNTSCLALPGVRAETQVIALDLAGIAVSAGAACSSGKVSRSHVLDAMGCGPLAGEAIRVSLPWNASAGDVAGFGVAYGAMAARLGHLVTAG